MDLSATAKHDKGKGVKDAMTDYAMFLASNAATNLDTALAHQTWGWTNLVLDHPGQIHSDLTGRQRVAALQHGDRLVIATGRRGASVTRRYDPLRHVILERFVDCRITNPLYSDTSSIWEPAPDRFSERVKFEVISETTGVRSETVGPELMIALTDSLNRSGTPFPFTTQRHNPGNASGQVFMPPPPTRIGAAARRTASTVLPPDYDYVADLLRRKAIGEVGEEFVVMAEQERLTSAGRPDLAVRVRWVAKTEGDGLGYDVRSFDEKSDNELHIEVKSTTGAAATPFPISAAEVRYSATAGDKYRLYRVFNLYTSPQIYVLAGDLAGRSSLNQPITSPTDSRVLRIFVTAKKTCEPQLRDPRRRASRLSELSKWSHDWQQGWSHATGKTNQYPVPCRWQATMAEAVAIAGPARRARSYSGVSIPRRSIHLKPCPANAEFARTSPRSAAPLHCSRRCIVQPGGDSCRRSPWEVVAHVRHRVSSTLRLHADKGL